MDLREPHSQGRRANDFPSAEWVSVVLGLLALSGVLFGVYGKYESDKTEHFVRIASLEKELESSSRKAEVSDMRLIAAESLARRNTEIIEIVRKDQDRFNDAFIKFADATDRLSISVARLEERIGVQEREPKLPDKL